MSNILSLEAEQLLALGYNAEDQEHYLNLRSKLTVLTYIRIADEICRQLPAKRPLQILDWGAGAGHMSFLLKERGLEVTSYDYDPDTTIHSSSSVWQHHKTFSNLDLPYTVSNNAAKLPFADQQFDAVLSCGVLEHVDEEQVSLDEIRRVLKSGGQFFIYQLPQKGSWLEFLIARFKLGYTHERKYSARGVRLLLANKGFKVRWLRRANMLPKNFTGLPGSLKKGFEKKPFLVLKADNVLAHVPLLNWISGVLELEAYKA